MQIPYIDRSILDGTGCAPVHVEPFLDGIDYLITQLNIILGNPGVFSNPITFLEGIIIPGGSLGDVPGSISWDSSLSAMSIRNEYPGSFLQIGHELYVNIHNNTEEDFDNGTVVCLDGFYGNHRFNIKKAKADSLDTAKLLGVLTTDVKKGGPGKVTVFGGVHSINTAGEVSGAEVYVSDTVAGGWTTIKPAVAIRIGYIGFVDTTEDSFLVNIDEKPSSILGSFYSAVGISFDGFTSKVIPLEGEALLKGLGHSTTENPEEITFLSSGSYIVMGNFQLNRDAGGASPESIGAWLQYYPSGGSAWENIPLTLIRQASTAQGDPARLSANVGTYFNKGDKLRVRAKASSSDIFFEHIDPVGDAPAQASVMFSVYRLGD